VSILVGVSVALLSVAAGLVVGLVSGYFRRLDPVLMRVMDGFMAIPGILFAMGLVALVGPGIVTVILAIVITNKLYSGCDLPGRRYPSRFPGGYDRATTIGIGRWQRGPAA
jgi:ABC-type microcin C transport system permease subunit YejE